MEEISLLKWLVAGLFRMTGKLRGHKKQRPTAREMQELSRIFKRTAHIAQQLSSSTEHMTVLEACLRNAVGHLDKKSRSSLFKAVNILVDANQKSAQQSIASKRMLQSLSKEQSNITADIVAKNLINTFLENVNDNNIPSSVRDDILKSVISRLAMELTHENIEQVLHFLLPVASEKKQQNYDRHMYG